MQSNGFQWKAQRYLEKQTYFPPLIEDEPERELKYSIIIPSAYEERLEECIKSLLEMDPVDGLVEILVILNLSESSGLTHKEMHSHQFLQLSSWSENFKHKNIRLKAIKPVEFPEKWAGVGMARKIGMDEAVRRFCKIGTDGLIFNVDADCTVHPNYLRKVVDFFRTHNQCQALSIGFMHPLTEVGTPAELQAIALYELHLRCYLNWQKKYQYLFAHHTLGSCFAVRCSSYVEQGGMNRRKAGEDFYFLHKFSKNYALHSMDEPLVYPSGRPSLRVPFGTGKAVHTMLTSDSVAGSYNSYNPNAIQVFCSFLNMLGYHYAELIQGKYWGLFSDNEVLIDFLEQNNFTMHFNETINNTTSKEHFIKRISVFLDPFCLMKFLHFAEQRGYGKMDVRQSANALLVEENKEFQYSNDVFYLLEAVRMLDYPSYKPSSFK